MSDNPKKTDFINTVNTVNATTEKTVKTFSLNKDIYASGKRFAHLLDIDHSQLLDKAVVEYIKNHQSDVPVAFNVNYIVPKIAPELAAAIETEAADHKRLLKLHIGKLQRALTKPTPIGTLNNLRRQLHTQVKRLRCFLKSAKGLHDSELLELFKEADKVLANASDKLEGVR